MRIKLFPDATERQERKALRGHQQARLKHRWRHEERDALSDALADAQLEKEQAHKDADLAHAKLKALIDGE